MADYYTQSSISFDATPEEAEKIIEIFEAMNNQWEQNAPKSTILKEIFEEPEWLGSAPTYEYEDGVFYIYDAQSAEPYNWALILQKTLCFNNNLEIQIPWGASCSKPRIDAYHGGTFIVTKDEILENPRLTADERFQIKSLLPKELGRKVL